MGVGLRVRMCKFVKVLFDESFEVGNCVNLILIVISFKDFYAVITVLEYSNLACTVCYRLRRYQ